MKFKSFPELKTERLNLIEVTEKHVAAIKDLIWYNTKNPTSDQAIETIQRSQNYFETGTGITWGLELDNEVIGTVGFYRGFKNETGEIGYVMREKFQRGGYMIEAIREVVHFGFYTMNLKRIEAHTAAENTPSVKLLLKLGFRNTGVLNDKWTIFELIRA